MASETGSQTDALYLLTDNRVCQITESKQTCSLASYLIMENSKTINQRLLLTEWRNPEGVQYKGKMVLLLTVVWKSDVFKHWKALSWQNTSLSLTKPWPRTDSTLYFFTQTCDDWKPRRHKDWKNTDKPADELLLQSYSRASLSVHLQTYYNISVYNNNEILAGTYYKALNFVYSFYLFWILCKLYIFGLYCNSCSSAICYNPKFLKLVSYSGGQKY